MFNNNKILIKDKTGQFKTVSLGSTNNRQQTTPKASSFYFNIKDEEEVAKFKDQKNQDVRQKKEEVLKNEAEKFIKMLPRELSTEQQSKFEKILISYLRGVRTELEVGEVMARELDKGGFGFIKDEARQYIKQLKNKKIYFEGLTFKKIKELNKKEESVNSVNQVNLANNKEVKIQNSDAELQNNIKQEEINPPANGLERPQRPQRPQKQENTAPKVQEIIFPHKKETDIPQDSEKYVKINKPTQSKKTQSPIDELANLTLDEFGTFGSSAKERVNRIYKKVSLLEEESIDKKDQGITAWKNSAVYKEYVLIGEESLSKNRPIKDIITEHGKLSLEDFNAIADLNEQFNY